MSGVETNNGRHSFFLCGDSDYFWDSVECIARKSNVVLALELQSAPDKIGDILYYTSVVDPELEYLGPNKWDFTC